MHTLAFPTLHYQGALKPMENSTNKPILIGIAFALPLLFIGVIVLTTTIPSSRLTTEYDFVYATCNEGQNVYSYNCSGYLNQYYDVVDGTLTIKVVPEDSDSDRDLIPDVKENYRTRLFVHDVDTNQSREITFDEVQSYSLRDLITSPDDVSVEFEASRSRGFFLFYDSRSNNGYYLTKGSARKELNLIDDGAQYYYSGNFMFVGWVLSR